MHVLMFDCQLVNRLKQQAFDGCVSCLTRSLTPDKISNFRLSVCLVLLFSLFSSPSCLLCLCPVLLSLTPAPFTFPVQATGPFLHIGALVAATALSWIVAGQVARAERTSKSGRVGSSLLWPGRKCGE